MLLQTIMKVLLTPINMVLSGIGSLVGAIATISGAQWAIKAQADIKGFQDKMNVMLTGSEATLLNSGGKVFTDSYDRHRGAYLEKHPEEAPGAAEEKRYNENESKFNKMVEAIKEGFSNPVPVNVELDITNPGTGPAQLRWNKMGQEFFDVMRAGI
jgi:hypothetical protein